MGVLAPASPCPAEEIKAGCSALERLGLKVALNVGSGDCYPRYLAASDEQRASCFNEFVRDPAIKALLCLRGGYGSLRILPRLSYAHFRFTPKALVGFSDITALLLACHTRAGVVCFHGPTVSSLATADPETMESLWAALSSSEPMVMHFSEALCLRGGRAEGSVLGGNLTTISHLLGTSFFPDLSDCILFLEDRGEPLYRIDRMLTQLMYSGSLDGVTALILGDFSESGARHELNDLVLERLASTSFPILSGIPVGHGQRNITLPLGVSATLDAGTGTLSYHQAATAS